MTPNPLRHFIAALAFAALIASPALADGPALQETPSLAAAVKDGKLPPIAERVPQAPLVITPTAIGTQGGALNLLMASNKDTKMMVVFGYARLVVYTPEYKLVPDILQSLDVEDGRSFTFHLRPGHKWSDGKPFTAEDFRYWFEDMAGNKELFRSGLPEAMLTDGKGPKFEVIDPETVRYTWPKRNPLFLPALAGPDPLYIYAPAHYMKQFHTKYGDAKFIEDQAKAQRARNWAALHTKLFHPYQTDNPELPVLDPWVLKTRPPAERFTFERNAYFHRIDPTGHQLPYVDNVELVLADAKIIPAKTGAGESDLQARYLRFDNYTFLKEAEERQGFSVRLWKTAPGSQLALYPNLNVNDPVWRKLMRDVRFRRALSLAIDRHEINQAIYYGLAIEGQNTVLPGSTLFEPGFRTQWTDFDIRAANRLLDEIGLTVRDSNGFRLMPDGRPLEIVIENAGESTEQSDVLELIRDTWAEAGIKLFSKPSQREIWRRRVYSGETMMSIDKGVENGLPTAEMAPWEFAPTTQGQVEWPKWGQYLETKGKAGEKIDVAEAAELDGLYRKWFAAGDLASQTEVWKKMLQINSDQLFTIGVVAGVLQPLVVGKRVRNVPLEGVYNWDPGAFFGVYHMDTFWLATDGSKQASVVK